MRLFFAIWPPTAAARALAQWARATQRVTGGRATDEGKIHLTLAFLGDVDPEPALAAAARVSARTHELPIEEARYWRDKRIVWAGPRQTPAALLDLSARLAAELAREGFNLEHRPFAAHLTLVRKARAAPLPPLPALAWPVEEFVLVRSTLSSAGSTYDSIGRFPLIGPEHG